MAPWLARRRSAGLASIFITLCLSGLRIEVPKGGGCAAQLAQAAECETSSARADSEGSAGPGRRAEGRPGLRKRRAVSGPVQPTRRVQEAEPGEEHASRDDEEVSSGAHTVFNGSRQTCFTHLLCSKRRSCCKPCEC